MEKKTNTPRLPLSALLFLLCVGGISLWNLLSPDREFSAAENRYLAQPPAFSLQKLFLDEDKWTLDFEAYMGDQFPFRDGWIGLKAGFERLCGRTENNGVYFAKNALIAAPPDPADAALAAQTAAAAKFAGAAGCPVYAALIPDAAWTLRDALPAYAPNGNEAALIADCYARMGLPGADIEGALSAHKDEYIYYRTDHHATALGAYYIYAALGDTLGYAPIPLSEWSRETAAADFRGTNAAKSGAWWVADDSIEIFHGPGGDAALLTYEGSEVATSGLYWRERLETGDKYTVFLGGNHPLQVIKTGNSGKKLLLIKDSFAHCIAPFLAAHYSEIHLLDMRYYRKSAVEYARQNNIEQALILYSVNAFVTEKNLVFLGG